jgi:hypothetical protein
MLVPRAHFPQDGRHAPAPPSTPAAGLEQRGPEYARHSKARSKAELNMSETERAPKTALGESSKRDLLVSWMFRDVSTSLMTSPIRQVAPACHL